MQQRMEVTPGHVLHYHRGNLPAGINTGSKELNNVGTLQMAGIKGLKAVNKPFNFLIFYMFNPTRSTGLFPCKYLHVCLTPQGPLDSSLQVFTCLFNPTRSTGLFLASIYMFVNPTRSTGLFPCKYFEWHFFTWGLLALTRVY